MLRRRSTSFWLASLVAVWLGTLACRASAPVQIIVKAENPGPLVSPLLFGAALDLTHDAAGGAFASLVKNGSFEAGRRPTDWKLHAEGGASASMQVEVKTPVSATNKQHLKLEVRRAAGTAAVINDGFGGMRVNKGEAYIVEFRARAEPPDLPIAVSIQGLNGAAHAREIVKAVPGEWRNFRVTLKSREDDRAARLMFAPEHSGTLWLDEVSLRPTETWRDVGLRKDVGQALENLRPAFVRFAGGCGVHGRTAEVGCRWKDLIGPVPTRKFHIGGSANGERHGLGLFECFRICEELSVEPVLVVQLGGAAKGAEDFDQALQDTLDCIEYATGNRDTTWGALRANHGHPKPFNLRYVQLENVARDAGYFEAYANAARAIKSRHPALTIIADAAAGIPTNAPVEMFQDHYENAPETLLRNAARYDAYPRNGPRLLVSGHTPANGAAATLRYALAEAVFMMGLERNGDVVHMSDTEPLLGSLQSSNWFPRPLNFSPAGVYPTPSFHVQQMFAHNRPGVILRSAIESGEMPIGLHVSAGQHETDIILKVVNMAAEERDGAIRLEGFRKVQETGTMLVLTSSRPDDLNTMEQPAKVAPATRKLRNVSAAFKHSFPAHSLTILRLEAAP